jgi:hypothetical protein
MRHSIPHDLAPDQLRRAVRQFADEYCQRFSEYQTSAVWHGEDELEVRFKVKGMALSGRLELLPGEIAVDMEVPLPFRLFKSKAVKTIEAQVRPWLDRARDSS